MPFSTEDIKIICTMLLETLDVNCLLLRVLVPDKYLEFRPGLFFIFII